MTTQIGKTKIVFGDPRQPKSLPLSHPKARWDPDQFGTKSYVIPKGHVRRRGCLPTPCDIQFDRDVPVLLRDGCKIYVDVYRPVESTVKVPAIMAWSPYGKQGGRGNQVLDDFPFRFGVPLRNLSEFQKWEGPDPGYWVQHGYAIVNPDPRGVGMSEGNIYTFGTQEGRDGADVIDWVGSQDWCSGRVAMSGNSYLSISQWFIAAEKPKHLAAIAPWEGFSDVFREFGLRGGVPSMPALNFSLQIAQVNFGGGTWENSIGTSLQNLEYTDYHRDKESKIENIDVPAYVVASWSNPVHVYGTFRAYCRLQSNKWLRVHDTLEWPDYYDQEWRADLHRFFDWTLKDIQNGWETTPRVRAKIIDTSNPLPNTGTLLHLPKFPAEDRTRPFRLYLNASDMTASLLYPQPSTVTYDASAYEEVSFKYEIKRDMIFCGPIEVQLSLSLLNATDGNIFVNLQKLLPSGVVAQQLIVPFEYSIQSTLLRLVHKTGLVEDTKAAFYRGPTGQIRVGCRHEDTSVAVRGFPVQDMTRMEPATEGKLYRVKVGMTPIGMKFNAGESLQVTIGAKNHACLPPVDRATLTVEERDEMRQFGKVKLQCSHVNQEFASFITLPLLD